ncbi:MAG: SusC/RagA family TonB-linked outer membrane protein [Cyclobacteriaceae bacterium]|nr:SusC/RagA family TonB-linked outer membrane protein [Cyclobacteriaceae bacterium]
MKAKLLKKIVTVSKYVFFGTVLQCILFTSMLAGEIRAQKSIQEIYVSVQGEDLSIMEVFSKIEQSTQFSFAYRRGIIDRNARIAYTGGGEASLADVLKTLAQQSGLKFRRVNDVIHVSKSTEQNEVLLEVVSEPEQTITITGRVTSSDSPEGLPGVNVVVKGTGRGTVTDLNGQYSIDVSSGQTVLVFSSVGYLTEEVVVGSRSVINLDLTADVTALDEIVVVGYGTQRERQITGAISTIDANIVEKTPTPSFEQALQGVASGVQVTSNDGSPEGRSRILIRGTNSVTAGTEPLIVLDGNPISFGGTTFLSQLNPNDIQSITILKDASSAAIYGSRGANGVILITTKTGKQGVSDLTFNYEAGIMQPINYIKIAKPEEWRQTLRTSFQNRFGNISDADANNALANQIAENLFNPFDSQRFLDEDLFNTVNNNWFDQVINDGSFRQYGLSSSKGTDKTSFFISGQYRSQEGSFIAERFDRYQLRTNLDFKPTDYLKLGINYNISLQNIDLRNKGNRTFQNSVDGLLNEGAFADWNELYGPSLPVFPVFWPGTDEPFDQYSGLNLVYSNSGNTSATRQVLNNVGNIYVKFEPLKNLVLNADLGINYNLADGKRWASDRARYLGVTQIDGVQIPLDSELRFTGQNRINEQKNRFLSMNYIGTAAYNFSIGDDHHISALAGIEIFDTYSNQLGYSVQGYPVFFSGKEDVLTLVREIESDKLLNLNYQEGPNERLFSRFMRVNYDYKNKYFVQFAFRRDGSSKFSPRNRYANFPSIGLGWIASDEDFINNDIFSFLKVKSSWGIIGNNAIGDFRFFNQYATNPQYAGDPAYIINRMGSGRIQWETTQTFDFGIDYGFLNNKIKGSITYFNSVTSDMLLDVRIPPSLGVFFNDVATSNVGSIKNYGLEVEINTVNVKTANFKWTSNFNITPLRNRVLQLTPGRFDQVPSRYSGSNFTAVIPNEMIGTFFIPEFGGYDDEGFPTIKVIDRQLADNQYEYVFLQNSIGQDSVVRASENAVLNNRVLQRNKTGLPTFFGGFGNNFTYKRLSLNVLFTFQGGNYILDDVGGQSAGFTGSWFREGLLESSWSEENPNAEFRRLYYGPLDDAGNPISNVSTHNLKRGDFLRLRNISLSYDLPDRWLGRTPMKSVSTYVNMTNVWTSSKFNRFDPEVLNDGGSNSRNSAQGFLTGAPPFFQFFTVSAGVNVKF